MIFPWQKNVEPVKTSDGGRSAWSEMALDAINEGVVIVDAGGVIQF